MYIVPLFSAVIILMGRTNNFVAANSKTNEQRILLRKLQNFEQNAEAEHLAWNDVLANVLVNKVTLFSSHNFDRETQKDGAAGIVRKCLSEVLFLFKVYVYDKFKSDSNITIAGVQEIYNTHNEKVPEQPKTMSERDPKSEVEIIEPKYHGRIEETTTESNLLCPEGYEANDGNCTATPSSKFIMYIPRQCPIGYRRDRLGYCRQIF